MLCFKCANQCLTCSENCFTCALKIEGRHDNDLEANRNDQEIEKNDKEEKNPKNPNSCLKTLASMAGDAKNIGETVGKNSLKLADAVMPF